MANTQPIMSKQFRIYIDSSTIAMATDFSLDFTKDMIEISYLSDAAYKTNLPDLKSWTVNFSGLQGLTANADASTLDYGDLMFKIMNSDASVAIAIKPRDVSGNRYLQGSGFLSSLNQSGGVGAATTFSGTLVGAGALTLSTV
jgi:hypothetical protein